MSARLLCCNILKGKSFNISNNPALTAGPAVSQLTLCYICYIVYSLCVFIFLLFSPAQHLKYCRFISVLKQTTTENGVQVAQQCLNHDYLDWWVLLTDPHFFILNWSEMNHVKSPKSSSKLQAGAGSHFQRWNTTNTQPQPSKQT